MNLLVITQFDASIWTIRGSWLSGLNSLEKLVGAEIGTCQFRVCSNADIGLGRIIPVMDI